MVGGVGQLGRILRLKFRRGDQGFDGDRIVEYAPGHRAGGRIQVFNEDMIKLGAATIAIGLQQQVLLVAKRAGQLLGCRVGETIVPPQLAVGGKLPINSSSGVGDTAIEVAAEQDGIAAGILVCVPVYNCLQLD